MRTDLPHQPGMGIDGPPPRDAWQFAQAILDQSISETAGPQTAARGARESCERLAGFSARHAEALRRLKFAEAEARHDREVLEWAAGISTRAAAELRALERTEADERDAGRRAEPCPEQWNAADHPRQPKGTAVGGQFAPTRGRSGGGFLGNVIRRHQLVGDLTGAVTPGMMRSSRLAAQLQATARLPAEVTSAAAAGLASGTKAIVNGTATTVKSVVTLGLSSSQLELIGVTQADRDRGYDTAVAIATASGQVLIAVGTSGLATALSKGGTVARTASGALVAFDAAGNAVGAVQGAYDASQNGVNLENGLKIAGGALGLTANAKAARNLSAAASAATWEQVEAYLAKCPRKPTPTKTPANQYEIAHTGPHNYTISGGGETFNIDGNEGTVILEAKHVGDVKSSPYVPGSDCYALARMNALNEVRDELRRVGVIIHSDETPFQSIEIITNTPESKALFEKMLKESGVPGTVRLAI